jgi:hypothetical protein
MDNGKGCKGCGSKEDAGERISTGWAHFVLAIIFFSRPFQLFFVLLGNAVASGFEEKEA